VSDTIPIVCILIFLVRYLDHRWTNEDVDKAREFYATHNAGHLPFPFPEHLFRKFVKENKGYFPVKIQVRIIVVCCLFLISSFSFFVLLLFFQYF
jgi:hypothetical protein